MIQGTSTTACGIGLRGSISKGEQSHEIILKGLQILINLAHRRGACGLAIPETGDGAGILIQVPHKFFFFFARASAASSVYYLRLPPPRVCTAVGMVFSFPWSLPIACWWKEFWKGLRREEGLAVLGMARQTPVNCRRHRTHCPAASPTLH